MECGLDYDNNIEEVSQMITYQDLAKLVKGCLNEKEKDNISDEACAGCPLGSVCSRVADTYKCVQL